MFPSLIVKKFGNKGGKGKYKNNSSKQSKFNNKRTFSTLAPVQTKTTANVLPALAVAGVFGAAMFAGYPKIRDLFESQTVAYAEEPAIKKAQPTPISDGNEHSALVIIYLNNNADLREVGKAAANLQTIVKKVSPETDKEKAQGEGAVAGVAFSPETWSKLCKAVRGLSEPKAMKVHQERKGTYGDLPNTGGEVFLHVKAKTYGLAFEVVQQFVNSLPKGAVSKVEDGYGFTYEGGKDLSGFADGTMNPSGEEDRALHGLIKANEDKNHEGGSFVIHQRWIHNVKAFQANKVSDQEAIVGRTRNGSVELDPLPKFSHVHRTSSRVVRDNQGNEVKIVRQSMPFGAVGGDHGLLFIAYTNDAGKFDRLLDRMTGKEDGTADALMKFSKCVRSTYWFMPNVQQLSLLK